MQQKSQQINKFSLQISCQNLKLEGFSQLNPMVIAFELNDSERLIEKGRTNILLNNKNPQFEKIVEINHSYLQESQIIFEVYHCSRNIRTLIGKAQTDTFILKNSTTKNIKIGLFNNYNKVGTITIIGQYIIQKNNIVNLDFKISNIDIGTFLCCFKKKPNNPKLTLFKYLDDNKNTENVYSEYGKKENNQYYWSQITLNSQILCNDNYQVPILIQLEDEQQTIGIVSLSIQQMEENLIDKLPIYLIEEQTREHKAKIEIVQCNLKYIPTFQDYIDDGLELNLMISIDFTDSNLQYTDQNSLHYFNYQTNTLSLYEKALRKVSEILIKFDTDKMIPMYGFGFILNDDSERKQQQCYPLNQNHSDPEVQNELGVLYSYRKILKKITFSGPTCIAPTIRKAMEMAKEYKIQGNKKYLILTILTDGIIEDFDETFQKIVDCSQLPISIIIIGIGETDFKNMDKLNNNDLQQMDIQGRKATRDLVQFVKFTQFQNDSRKLSNEVLKELPDQLVEYMQKIGKMPNQSIILQRRQLPPLNYENSNSGNVFMNRLFSNYSQQTFRRSINFTQVSPYLDLTETRIFTQKMIHLDNQDSQQ